MAGINSGATKGIMIDGQAASKRALNYKYYKLPRYFVLSPIFASATSSNSVSLMDFPAGVGIFGKASGIVASSITKSGS